MSGLFDSLTSASRSLNAARLGLDVAGQNLANVNTEGYARRTLQLVDEAPPDAMSAGRGVSVAGIKALRDMFVESRLRNEKASAAYDDAIFKGLTEVEAAIGSPGTGLDAQLSAYFDAFSTLSNDPTSAAARDNVVVQARQLAQAFHSLSTRFESAQRNADVQIVSAVTEINQLATQVAALNEQIIGNGSDVETLRDRRDLAVSRLSELAGVSVTARADGGVDLSIGQGRPLVIGNASYAVTASPSGAGGLAQILTGGFDITSEITGGQIGGLLKLRDTLVPGYQGQLDQLAVDLTSQVNALHQAGFDATGAAAGAFFTPLGGVAGAAALFSVDAAVAANTQLVAASGTGAVGDNATARAIAGLRNSRIVNGGTSTPNEAWGLVAYRIGADVAAAKSSSAAHADVVAQLQRLRDQTSGVSMDEEAANLMRFQRAYEANARYFTTIMDTLDVLMGMVR